MPKQEKQTLLPKLRFPEFREAGEWQSGQLEGALSSISNGLILEQGSDATGYKVTRIETISAGTIDLEKVGLVKTSQDISAYKLQVGDILFSNINSVAHIGKSVFVDRDYDLYHGMNLLRLGVNRSKHDPQFIFYLINTDGIRTSLRERANKAVNQASINQTELGKTEVSLPLVPEQQKIADCLASLDELITLESQQLDTLKTHKKGLMQGLFPSSGGVPEGRGGEHAEATTPRLRRTPPKEGNYPRLRFPEFRDAGEWEERNLGRVAENLDNRRIPITSSDRVAGKIPYYGASGVVDYVKGFIFDEDLLCISEDGANLVARTYPIAFPISGKTWVNNHAHVLRFETPRTQKFVEVYLNSIKLDDFITGMAQPKLNKAMLDSIPIPWPTIPEQERIADCLISLDDLITTQTQKIAALKNHKKGLMQQLFPDTATTPPLRGTPPEEGNKSSRASNSPPVEGWTAKLDGVVNMKSKPDGVVK